MFCARCPNKEAPDGCPCWVGPELGLLETNVQTGEERLVQGCFYEVIPKLMIHVIRASNRPAAAFEGLRNTMLRGLEALAARPMLELPSAENEE